MHHPPEDTQRTHILDAIQKQKNALAPLRITGSPTEVGQGLVTLAELHGLLEDHAASRQLYEEALEKFLEAKYKPGQAQALMGLGVVKANFEDHRGAIDYDLSLHPQVTAESNWRTKKKRYIILSLMNENAHMGVGI